MKKRIIGTLLIIVVTAIALNGCGNKDVTVDGRPDIGGVYEQMYSADFWIDGNSETELMTAKEIQTFNYNMYNGTIYKFSDINNHKTELTEDELRARLEAYSIPTEPRYTGTDGRIPVTKEQFNKMRANMNMSSIEEINPVRWAVIVNETSLRSFPDDTPIYEEEGNMDIDLFHQNKMKVWEKCLVLHTSGDGLWHYIQTVSFRGWIKAEDAAICDKDAWLKYNAMDFLVVTGNRIALDNDPYDSSISGDELLMGTRLPLVSDTSEVNRVSTVSSYTILMPARAEDGTLIEKTARIPRNADVNMGYLPLTGENIIRQSFKMIGERYGWGGSLNARDCSSFIRDIYFCFGIEVPRNSAAQGSMKTPGRTDTSHMNDDQKEELIKTLHPGALLEMQGHVMMYLGEHEGKAYIIHAVYAFGESGKNGAYGRKNIGCVTISDLYVTRKDGSTFISNIRSVVPFD